MKIEVTKVLKTQDGKTFRQGGDIAFDYLNPETNTSEHIICECFDFGETDSQQYLIGTRIESDKQPGPEHRVFYFEYMSNLAYVYYD